MVSTDEVTSPRVGLSAICIGQLAGEFFAEKERDGRVAVHKEEDRGELFKFLGVASPDEDTGWGLGGNGR